MKRNKKNNLFLKLTMVFAMFMFMVSPFSVLAADKGKLTGADVEQVTCKANTERTIYYLFLDAQDTNHSSTSDGTTTHKDFYAPKVSGERIKAAGVIDVVGNGNSSATNKTSWNLNTFYTKFNSAVNKTSFVDKTDSKNIYAMSTKWFKHDGTEYDTNAAADLTVSQLTNASTWSTDVKTDVDVAINTSTMKATITRYYGEVGTWGGIVSSRNLQEVTVSVNGNANWHPYFHPYVVYLTLCEPDENQSGTNPSEVTLTYNANAGSDKVDDLPKAETKEKGKEFTASSKTPSRSGYVFKGWADSADGSVKYTANQKIGNLTSNKTIYAVWEKVPADGFGLNYDANGGVGAPGPETANAGECITISSTKPSLSGAKFLGWSTKKGATSPDSDYNAGKEYCGKYGDLTLYAVWSGGAATSNPKTGVADYAIAFGLLGAAAGAGLLISKRKKLFKQI